LAVGIIVIAPSKSRSRPITTAHFLLPPPSGAGDYSTSVDTIAAIATEIGNADFLCGKVSNKRPSCLNFIKVC
jgi:hypothetical protein